MIIIKPHAIDHQDLIKEIENLVFEASLSVLIDRNIRFKEEHVLAIYEERCKSVGEGEDGLSFVRNLVESFVGENRDARIMVVSGVDSYKKLEKIKRQIREIGGVDLYRNVIHTSDDFGCTKKELNSLFPGIN